MINPKISRINIFGASDTKKMMMGLGTKGFKEFWLVKTGQKESDFTPNKYTRAGSLLEHDILSCVDTGMTTDEVYNHADYPRLVVNTDGVIHKLLAENDIIYECKTTKYENLFFGKVTSERDYIRQVNVQMFATGFRKAYIVYYGMLPSEYEIEFLLSPDIDINRIEIVEVKYDEKWINEKYIPRLTFLSECIDNNVLPWEVNNETGS